jgi:hypothetical protein
MRSRQNASTLRKLFRLGVLRPGDGPICSPNFMFHIARRHRNLDATIANALRELVTSPLSEWSELSERVSGRIVILRVRHVAICVAEARCGKAFSIDKAFQNFERLAELPMTQSRNCPGISGAFMLTVPSCYGHRGSLLPWPVNVSVSIGF